MDFFVKPLGVYLIIVNVLGLFMMLADKRLAIVKARRVPEAWLFTVALAGGSIGSIAGMRLFRHKTRHKRFYIGLPLILLLQLIIPYLLLF